MVERIPLHSLATSIVTPGRENRKSWRKTRVPVTVKIAAVTSADDFCRPTSAISTTDGGNGMKRIRNSNGTRARRNGSKPKIHRNPAIQTKTRAKADNHGFVL